MTRRKSCALKGSTNRFPTWWVSSISATVWGRARAFTINTPDSKRTPREAIHKHFNVLVQYKEFGMFSLVAPCGCLGHQYAKALSSFLPTIFFQRRCLKCLMKRGWKSVLFAVIVVIIDVVFFVTLCCVWTIKLQIFRLSLRMIQRFVFIRSGEVLCNGSSTYSFMRKWMQVKLFKHWLFELMISFFHKFDDCREFERHRVKRIWRGW